MLLFNLSKKSDDFDYHSDAHPSSVRYIHGHIDNYNIFTVDKNVDKLNLLNLIVMILLERQTHDYNMCNGVSYFQC